ncbi:MAG: putative Co/Zn/Cd efflux system rane fusion protein [Labilithrix sp.]|nr:putative Co/Zn/Cd efflux system rane fusion protein [Labilithrix sp.]
MRLVQLLSVAAITVLCAGAGAGCKKPAAADKSDAELPPANVRTQPVAEVEAPVTLRLTGTLKGMRETDLAANAVGRVVSTSVERGAQVKAGQVLAQLDVRAAAISATEANAMAESARTSAAQLKADCQRAEALKASGSISAAEFDRTTAQCRTSSLSVEAQTARAQMAAQNVGDGSVRAPFAGVVTERYVDVGEYVRADSRVVTIVSVDQLRLELAIPEADAAKVKEEAEVGFHVSAFPDRKFVGKVRFVSGAIRSATRDLVVEAIVDNADKALKPGMFADVEVVVGVQKVAGIPKEAIVEKDGKFRAFFVVDGRLQERVLSVLPEVPGGIPILKGAKLGEAVALGDLKTLANGQRTR